eukprot:6182143-Pleurochrysis_carterae.AAC.3
MDCNLGDAKGSVLSGRMRGVKVCNASAGDARSGAGESRSTSLQIRSSRSHARTRSTQERSLRLRTEARIRTLTPQERVCHGVIGGDGQRKGRRQEWSEGARAHRPALHLLGGGKIMLAWGHVRAELGGC